MKTKTTSRLNYAFAGGKIRALERFLIRQEVFEEAIESDLGQALRLFVESDLYSDELLHIKDAQHLESVLNQELLKLKKTVCALILDKPLLELIDLNTIDCAKNVLKIYPSAFLQEYLMSLIDMHNIKSFLRLYILQEPQDELNKILTCEGFIKKKDLLDLYAKDLAAFLNKMEYVFKYSRTEDYTYYLGEAVQRTAKEGSFIYLEKAINDFLMRILKQTKYLTFGPEPVLAYYFGKQNEINLIRMIILAKLNNVSVDLVKARLNSVYA